MTRRENMRKPLVGSRVGTAAIWLSVKAAVRVSRAFSQGRLDRSVIARR
eukprot:gene6781-9161_t